MGGPSDTKRGATLGMSRDLLAAHPRLKRVVYRAMTDVAATIPYALAWVVAWGIGTLVWLIDGHGRRTVARNLAHLIPAACPDARARAVRRSYTAFAVAVAESLRLHRLPHWLLAPERLTLVDPYGVFLVRPRPGPAVMVTVHSNWELLLAAAHRLNLVTQVEAIARTHGDPVIDHIFERRRAAVGCRSLLLDRAPLASLRALKDGRVLGLLGDRAYSSLKGSGHGLRMQVAGAPMRVPSGPAALAVQTGAPVIPVALLRSGPLSFTLVVGKPLCADATLPKGAQVADLSARVTRALTRFIACAPAQWVAFHDAWESR